MTPKHARAAALAAAWLACAAAAPARAQEQPTIRPGQTVTGTLASTDPTLSERGPFKVYRFTARRGDRLMATMRSADFDAYLTVARNVAGITDNIETDDDGGGNTDARVRFTAPADGAYLLVAQALEEGKTGSFTLALEVPPAPTTAQAREIRVGQTVSGTLAETDAMLDEDETYYDTYTLSARQGERLLVDMKSDAFDAYLAFGKMENGEFKQISTDDDGGDSTNARLRVQIDAPGEYMIRANSLGTATGAYTLTLTQRPAAPAAAAPRPIRLGQEVTGQLTEDDASMEDESFYDYYTLTGRTGERLRITMKSTDFDTFLAIGKMEGTTFSEIASNDDGGDDGTNSQLEVTLPGNGTYVIRANSLSGGNTGSYTVKVDRIVEQ